MSEKYITLNHLETATKSLIAKIDEEINDLSPVAQSGDYEDLENKPNLSQVAYTGSYEDLINPPDGVKYLNIDRTYYYDDLKELVKGTCSSIILYDAVDYTDETLYNFYYLTNKSGGWRTQSGTINLTFLGETKKVTCSINKDDSDPVVFVETPITTETPTPDWEQNDSTADDYIKNRTHWIEVNEDFTWIDNENIVFSSETTQAVSEYLDETVLSTVKNSDGFISGETYKVILNETEYNLTCVSKVTSDLNLTVHALGNTSLASITEPFDSSENLYSNLPFCITFTENYTYVRINRDTSQITGTTISLSISGPINIYHHLNSYYLDGKLITKGTALRAEIFNSPKNIASGNYSHAEGNGTEASAMSSHAEGTETIASGSYSHAEGGETTASGNYSHAEGRQTSALGGRSHAEGERTVAKGLNSHAEGNYTYAIGQNSHAEGSYRTWSNVPISKPANSWDITITDATMCAIPYPEEIAEDNITFTSGLSLGKITNPIITNGYLVGFTAEMEIISSSGIQYEKAASSSRINIRIGTTAKGNYSHAEGSGTFAKGNCSHTEGFYTHAIDYSHAEGYRTRASSENQHVQGKYNIPDANGIYADIVGNGTAKNACSNAYTLDWSGNGVYAGKVTVGTAPTADMDVATKLYVDTAMSNVSTDLVGLTDTTITTPTEGQILIYDATNSKWINSNFTAVSAESDTNVNDMLDDFSLDYTSDSLSPNVWVGGSY